MTSHHFTTTYEPLWIKYSVVAYEFATKPEPLFVAHP